MISLIGDIHGHLEALEWALEATRGTTRISLGDVVDGPNDDACIRLLRDEQVVVLQGNHDYWAASGDVGSSWQPEPVKQWLACLPRRHEGGHWLAYHSRYQQSYGFYHWDYLDDPRMARQALDETHHQLVFCGHTHVPAIQMLQGDTDTLTVIPGTQLQSAPVVTLDARHRYLVHVGRPTQCVVLYDEDQRTLQFVFAESPRFERRFRELLLPPG